MTTIPLIPLLGHPTPIDPDLDTLSIDTSDGVVVTTYRLRDACYVTVTYPGPPCQSWAVAAPLPDTAAAEHCATLLLSDRTRR